MNLNDFAVEISQEEGLKKNTSIAQIKEILRIVLSKLKHMDVEDVITLLARIK